MSIYEVFHWTRAVAIVVVAVAGLNASPHARGEPAGLPTRMTVPEVNSIAGGHVVVTAESSPQPRCQVALTNRDVAAFVRLLERVDWAQPGESVENVRLKPYEIEITLVDDEGRKWIYGTYWRGETLVGDQRVLAADLGGLRQAVVDLLLRHICCQPLPKLDPVPKREADPPSPKDVKQGPQAVDRAELIVVASPSGTARPQCTLRTEDAWRIGNVEALLQRIDWAQPGKPLERMQIVKPDIALKIVKQNGDAREYQFYWNDEGLIDCSSQRMLDANVDGLRRQVIELLIAHCADLSEHANVALQRIATLQPKETPFAVALAPDARSIAVAYPRKGEVVLWDVERQCETSRRTDLGRVRQIAFTPTGDQLVCLVDADSPRPTAANELSVQLVDVHTLRKVRTLGVVRGGGWQVPIALSRDGAKLAVLSSESVKLWNNCSGKLQEIETERALPRSPRLESHQPRLCLSRDGNLLAVAAGDRSIVLWELANAAKPHEVATWKLDGPMASLDFSPDGKLLVVGPGPADPGGDAPAPHIWSTAALAWDVDARSPILLPLSQPAIEMQVAFAPSGMLLVTAGGGTMTLWDLTNWKDQDVKLLDTAKTHREGIHGLVSAGCAPVLLSYGSDAIHVWRLVRPAVDDGAACHDANSSRGQQ